MDAKYATSELLRVSKAMFKQRFFGIFHGSISAKIVQNQFIINKKDAIFSDLKEGDFSLLLAKKDYRWTEASIDSDIHLNIYKSVAEAKFICYALPPYLSAYSLNHDILEPKDYFCKMRFGPVPIYNPKQFEDWYERAPSEIARFFVERKTSVMVIAGYGIYAYGRSASELAKSVALLENSARVLSLASAIK